METALPKYKKIILYKTFVQPGQLVQACETTNDVDKRATPPLNNRAPLPIIIRKVTPPSHNRNSVRNDRKNLDISHGLPHSFRFTSRR
jgi:hypothetical protein